MIGVGTRVLAEWSAGRWYRGAVRDVAGPGPTTCFVRFDDGDEGWIDARRVVDEGGQLPSVRVGERVLAPWNDATLYAGRVTAVSADLIDVAFDDGDRARVAESGIRRVDGARVTASVGCRVYGRWETGAYYRGIVEAADPGGWRVLFDDTDRAVVAHDGLFVIDGPVAELAEGTTVLVRRPNGRFAHGVVRTPSRTFVLVALEDGEESMVPVHDVVPRAGGIAPPYGDPRSPAAVSYGTAPQHRRCAYCQRLSAQSSVQCDHCGAPF